MFTILVLLDLYLVDKHTYIKKLVKTIDKIINPKPIFWIRYFSYSKYFLDVDELLFSLIFYGEAITFINNMERVDVHVSIKGHM